MTDAPQDMRRRRERLHLDDFGGQTFENLGRKLDSACEGEGSFPATDLLRTLEGEVLPRLMLAHKRSFGPKTAFIARSGSVPPETIERFVSILLTGSATTASQFVDGILADGLSAEALFLQLMGPTARRLGELWDNDECSFADVTVGLCRLHELLRHNSVVGDDVFRSPIREGPSILLATACGDQHVFGILVVAEFFRRDAWRVWSEPGASLESLVKIVSQNAFDMIGLSVTRSVSAEELTEEIVALRKASANPDMRVLVGGDLVTREVGFIEQVDADGSAPDAAGALELGRSLLAQLR